MMRSLSSAVAGLRTHQTKMDVIGNNIANVNTYGFKASRTTFADVYYQNLSSGRSGATGTKGGTNPTQIGYGSAVATIDVMMGVSSGASTNSPLDVFITGDGFLVSKDQSGQILYSRLGNLGFDPTGNLVDGNGNRIQGFPMNPDGTPQISADGTILGEQLQSIWLDPAVADKIKSISISSTGAITGLMDGDQQISAYGVPDWMNASSISIPITSVYSGTVNVAISGFCETTAMETALGGLAAGSITGMEMGTLALPASAAADGNTIIPYSVAVDKNGNVTLSRPAYDGPPKEEAVSLSGSFKNGKLVIANAKGEVALSITFDPTKVAELAESTAKPLELELYQQMTTTDKGGNVVKYPADKPEKYTEPGSYPQPMSFGELSFTITGKVPSTGFNGVIGTAEPGESIVYNIGNLVLAKFRNDSGLQQSGTSYFVESLNSGEATYVLPGMEGTGALKSAYLEQSNVDISQEFTDMITTQRGFQANSRIITVSDEMLQELVNLKR